VKPDGDYLDASTVTRVEIKNPNSKMAWYFGGTSFAISTDGGGDLNLGFTTIPGLTIKAKEVTILKAETSSRNGGGGTIFGGGGGEEVVVMEGNDGGGGQMVVEKKSWVKREGE